MPALMAMGLFTKWPPSLISSAQCEAASSSHTRNADSTDAFSAMTTPLTSTRTAVGNVVGNGVGAGVVG